MKITKDYMLPLALGAVPVVIVLGLAGILVAEGISSGKLNSTPGGSVQPHSSAPPSSTTSSSQSSNQPPQSSPPSTQPPAPAPSPPSPSPICIPLVGCA